MIKPSLFWFPWCTGQYKQSFIDKKIPELRASNEYFGVKQVGWQIHVKMARNPEGIGMLDRKEWEERHEADK